MGYAVSCRNLNVGPLEVSRGKKKFTVQVKALHEYTKPWFPNSRYGWVDDYCVYVLIRENGRKEFFVAQAAEIRRLWESRFGHESAGGAPGADTDTVLAEWTWMGAVSPAMLQPYRDNWKALGK
jgi:hypothetical protein